MKRPRLTAKVVRGFRHHVLPDAAVSLEMGCGDGLPDEGHGPKEHGEASAALTYLYALADWYEKTHDMKGS